MKKWIMTLLLACAAISILAGCALQDTAGSSKTGSNYAEITDDAGRTVTLKESK